MCIIAEANDAFEEALKLDPANAQAKSGHSAVKRALESQSAPGGLGEGPGGGFGNMFNDPQLIQKLARNPKTSKLLGDPSFMAKLQKLREDPNGNMSEALGDPRFLQVMGVLMGIDMSFASEGPGQNKNTEDDQEEDIAMPDAYGSSKANLSSKKTTTPPKAAEPEPQPEPEDEESTSLRKAKEEAEAEKKLGTENYKKRQFDAAIQHYARAWDLHKDITYLTNMSAAKFEKGDYEGAIQDCQKAIEEGREVLADFKIIAK